jgi:glycosyltransferase involved in cell wall biosynthesis
MEHPRAAASGPRTYEEFMSAVRSALTPPPSGNRPGNAEPQVTVAMPAYNAAPYVGNAAASVLNQAGVGLELVVVDDGSTDGTAEVVESIRDSRIRLLRNPARRGIAYSHNRVVAESRAPILVHVDADDFILPGALARVLEALNAAPAAGQVFAEYIAVDANARIGRAEFERQRDFLLRRRLRSTSLRHDLLVHGMVANPLRGYRKTALAAAGPFNERLKYAVDYDMTVRIADRFELQLIPEILYCQRIHATNTQERLRLRALRSWWTRLKVVLGILDAQPALLGFSRTQVYQFVLAGLGSALGLDAALKKLVRTIRGNAA